MLIKEYLGNGLLAKNGIDTFATPYETLAVSQIDIVWNNKHKRK